MLCNGYEKLKLLVCKKKKELIDELISLYLIDNRESCADYDSEVSRYLRNPMHLQVTI